MPRSDYKYWDQLKNRFVEINRLQMKDTDTIEKHMHCDIQLADPNYNFLLNSLSYYEDRPIEYIENIQRRIRFLLGTNKVVESVIMEKLNSIFNQSGYNRMLAKYNYQHDNIPVKEASKVVRDVTGRFSRWLTCNTTITKQCLKQEVDKYCNECSDRIRSSINIYMKWMVQKIEWILTYYTTIRYKKIMYMLILAALSDMNVSEEILSNIDLSTVYLLAPKPSLDNCINTIRSNQIKFAFSDKYYREISFLHNGNKTMDSISYNIEYIAEQIHKIIIYGYNHEIDDMFIVLLTGMLEKCMTNMFSYNLICKYGDDGLYMLTCSNNASSTRRIRHMIGKSEPIFPKMIDSDGNVVPTKIQLHGAHNFFIFEDDVVLLPFIDHSNDPVLNFNGSLEYLVTEHNYYVGNSQQVTFKKIDGITESSNFDILGGWM
nr:MAG TPA: hypothetical protein [Caudoviricetes sp.]